MAGSNRASTKNCRSLSAEEGNIDCAGAAARLHNQGEVSYEAQRTDQMRLCSNSTSTM